MPLSNSSVAELRENQGRITKDYIKSLAGLKIPFCAIRHFHEAEGKHYAVLPCSTVTEVDKSEHHRYLEENK